MKNTTGLTGWHNSHMLGTNGDAYGTCWLAPITTIAWLHSQHYQWKLTCNKEVWIPSHSSWSTQVKHKSNINPSCHHYVGTSAGAHRPDDLLGVAEALEAPWDHDRAEYLIFIARFEVGDLLSPYTWIACTCRHTYVNYCDLSRHSSPIWYPNHTL